MAMSDGERTRRRRRKLISQLVTFASFLLLLFIDGSEGCMDSTGKYDFTSISRYVWNVTEKRGSDTIEYRIKVCNALEGPLACSGSSICAIGSGGSNAINLGNYVDRPVIDQDEDDDGFWMKFEGETCSDGENYRTLINFQCGNSLGSPIFIGTFGCSTYFVWNTSVACEKPSTRKEVPCYVHDSNGVKYDLNSLVRSTGGYFLSTGVPVVEFYINVCSEIVPDEATKGCPSGVGACRVIGSEVLSFGELVNGLQLNSNGDLLLTYVHENVTFPSGCSNRPRTTITFVCPIDGMDWNPVIFSDSNCDYQIEWITNKACPLKQLESSDGCRLSSDIDGIQEELSSLRIESGNPYHADGTIDGKMYDFYLSLCGGFPAGFSCNGSSLATVCRKSVDDHKGVVIGTSVNQSLRYADGQLYLSYTNGGSCRLTGPLSKRSLSTVILFKCGLESGEPRFIQEEDCVSFFEWETKNACVERMLGIHCYVEDNGKIIDLSSLTREHEKPWIAVGGESVPMGGSEIYINVCGPVARMGPSTECPVGSAVCIKSADGKMVDFGRYVKRPELDAVTGDVILNYTSSVSCPSNPKTFITSIIRFICQPGKVDSAPRVVRSSLDGCLLELEWPTVAACVQVDMNGTDCKVRDDDLGIDIDLGPLRKSNGYYNVTVGNKIYFINVCGGVTGTRCVGGNEPIGACQTNVNDSETFLSLGLATDLLSYYDGLIKLTYVGGAPYKSDDSIERQTNILFECDRVVGAGHPLFMNEFEHVTNFKWRTSYACLPLPIECVFQNEATQEQFDLSRLSRGSTKEDWEIVEPLRGKKRKFYLNVCRSLTRNDKEAENACTPGAAVCATQYVGEKEVPFIANLGKAESAPRFEDGQLILRYSSGDVCTESQSGANYSTVIYFHCFKYSVPSEDGPSPIFLRNQSCEYVFLWSNQAVCPLRASQNVRSCSITDPNTGYTFSFNSLNGDFRIPATGSNTFRDFYINFCGRVNESICNGVHTSSRISACAHLRGNNKSLALALQDTRRLQVSSSGFVTMQFDGPLNATTGKSDYRMEIVFICHRQMNASRPKFIHQEGDLLVFHYESPLTCPPHSVDCKFHDSHGNSYDLTSLSRGSGHYEVRDPRPDRKNILYHLNVCQPVKSPAFSNCPETNIGACMSDSKSGIGYSLGYVQGKPRPSTGPGTVSIRYLSGSSCNNGTHHRSTRIDFSCSSQHGEPRFVDETADCEYIFSWETPLACPLQQVIGSKCHVVDPRYSSHFNVSKLSKPEGYVVTGPQKIFAVNVCQPLSYECGGQLMAGVCVEENGVKTSGGLYSDQLVYDQGDLTLTYNGGSKTSVIKFVCDHTATGETEGPSFLASVSTENSFVFLWKTSYACRNYKDSNCKIYGPNGTFYDLSRLTLLDGNYEFIANNGSYKYLINVCRSVVHTKDAMCHYGSAVCGVNTTEINVENKYFNLGEVGNGPYIKNGVLKLTYEMGEMCRHPDSSNFHKKTTITFECNPMIEEGEPYLLAEDGCNYDFVWSTSSACPIQQVENVELGDCTVVNPNTGYRFDLSLLKRSSYVVGTPIGYNLTIGVCDPILNSPCGPDVGSCFQSLNGSTKATNVGKANSHLHYRSEMLVLNYTDGEPCGVQGSKTTIFTFFCGTKGTGLGKPEFVDESGCTYFVSWYTELACEQKVHCSVEMDGEVFDLGSLSEQQGHHFAVSSTDDAVYVLNVCRPLNSFAGYKCPLQSAACRIDRKSNTSLSLGIVDRPPYVGSGGHIVLDYVNGSQCPENPQLNISTRIIFICDDSFTHDVLRMADVTPDCTYVLEWPTDLVCPTVTHGQTSPNCSYYDNRTKKYFDLAYLRELSPSGYKVNFDVEDNGSIFTVSYCGMPPSGSDACSSAAVCLDIDGVRSSWGNAATALYDYDGQVLRVAYKDGDQCSHSQSDKQTSVIYFVCDPNAGHGTPELAKSFDCQVVFYWRTSLMCTGNTPDCTLLHNGHLYDLRLLSSYSHSWTIDVFPTLEKFWFNVCGQLTGDRNPRCPLDSAVCWTMAADKLVSLGSSDSQILTMSDDEQTLKLSYSTKTGVCRDGSNWISSSTRSVIEFVCSLNANQPQLISRGDQSNNCTFSFKWETPVACPEKRQREVLELYGKIFDASLDLTLDLSRILSLKESTVEHRGPDDYLYWINLSGMESYPSDSECHGAAICQTKPNNSSFQRNLGFAEGRRFFLQGPQLIAVLITNSVCSRNAMKNVSSSITFRCSMSAGLGRPTFIYESVDCIYLFDWESEVLCNVEAFAMKNGDISDVAESSSGFGSTIGIVIVMLALILLVIGIVFRSRERRATVAYRLQDYPRRKPSSTVSYTPLPTNDTDNTEVTSLLFSTRRFGRSKEGSLVDSDDDDIIEF